MLWEVLESKIMYTCRVFAVRRDQSRSLGTGKTHDFHVLEARDWVNVVPITPDGGVVMVRQFRHGIGAVTLEVPAGIIDPTDASPAVAGARELREETGYAGEDLLPLGCVYPNPAILNNRCHIFAAYDVREVGPPQWDGTEEMAVEIVRREQVPSLIRSGVIGNALTVVAFQLLGLRDPGVV